VNALNGPVFRDERRIGGTAAEIENGKGRAGSRGGERTPDCHLRFHSPHGTGNQDFILDLARQPLHGEFVGLHHGGKADGIAQGVLTGQGSEHPLRFEGVDGEDIAHGDLLNRLIGQFRHYPAYLFEHAPDIGTRFGLDFRERGHLLDPPHDHLGPFFNGHLGFLTAAEKEQFSSRDPPFLDIAQRSLDDDCAADAHEGPGNGYDAAGLLRVQCEDGGDVVRIGQPFDASPGRRHLDRRWHAHGDSIDVLHLIDNGHGAQQTIVNQHPVVVSNNGTDYLSAGAHQMVEAGRSFPEIHCSRNHHDPLPTRRSGTQGLE